MSSVTHAARPEIELAWVPQVLHSQTDDRETETSAVAVTYTRPTIDACT